MGSERGDLAAARVRAAALRAEQLRERIARLRAGVAPTRTDVERARSAADAQRTEALKAHQRLLLTYAVAGDLGRRATSVPARGERGPGAQALEPESVPEEPLSDVDMAVQRLSAENRLLRDFLVSIAAVSSENDAGWPADRRRQLWRELVDQCGRENWQGWARALCVTAASSVPGVRGVAVSGYDDHRVPHLLAVTDEWTRRVEEIHQLVGEGPAVDAYKARTPILVTRLVEEQARWPGFVSAAADTTLTAVYALPIRVNDVCIGSLTFYRSEEQGPALQEWLPGAYLAAVAAEAVLADLDAVEDGFYPWHSGDHQVQVAAGMVSIQLDVSVDQALALLRAFAFSNARGLDQVAEAIIDGSMRLT